MVTTKQKELIIKLGNLGYSNWQISIETGMKLSTVHFWKRKLRAQGIQILNISGRPKNISKTRDIKLISTIEEYNKQNDPKLTQY